MNALDYLKKEHVKAKSTFKEIEAAAPGGRGDMWLQLEGELKIHEEIEHLHVYGPLARANAAKGTKLEEWDRQHTVEVSAVKDVIKTMEGLDASTDAWLQNLKQVNSLLDEHIREEEQEIWPEIRKVWDEDRLQEAGKKLEETHSEKMRATS